jgi:RNA polymerase sigma factor (sigma-70 family)
MPDDDLIAGCRQNEREAHAGLVKKYTRRIFAICYGILGNIDDAEDAVQETFLKAFQKIGDLRTDDQFFPWIARIARNLCLDFLRRRKNREVALSDVPDQAEQSHQDNTDYQDFQDTIRRLPDQFRLPLVLYYFDGRSTKNIAEALEISEAAVHTRLSRARKELRRLLNEKEAQK